MAERTTPHRKRHASEIDRHVSAANDGSTHSRPSVRKMTPYAEIEWGELKSAGPNPVEYLRRNGLRVYVRLVPQNQIAYRFADVECPGDLVLPTKGFDVDVGFLALDDRTLRELAVSRTTVVREFVSGGLRWANGPANDATVEDVQFERCYVLSDVAKADVDRQRAAGRILDYSDWASNLLIELDDLWLEDSVAKQIRQADMAVDEVVRYPYDHRLRFPALYWMFQAACKRNRDNLLLSDEELVADFREKNSELFSDKRAKCAAKFVRRRINRGRGRKLVGGASGAKPLRFSDLPEWTDAERFTFPFVSEGLSLILAVADWWLAILEQTPNEPVSSLAGKFLEQNFDVTEAGHLTYLLAGRYPPNQG